MIINFLTLCPASSWLFFSLHFSYLTYFSIKDSVSLHISNNWMFASLPTSFSRQYSAEILVDFLLGVSFLSQQTSRTEKLLWLLYVCYTILYVKIYFIAFKIKRSFSELFSTFVIENIFQLNYRIIGLGGRRLTTIYNIVSMGKWL